MKIVMQPWWLVFAQIGAATAWVIGGMCIAGLLSMMVDWVTE